MAASPRVRVSVAVVRDGMVLWGRRRGGVKPGTWSLPGGKIDWGEAVEDCARRETREECGVEIDALTQLGFAEFRTPRMHFITLFVSADWASGEAEVLEPHRFFEWRWAAWDDPPLPLFPSLSDFQRLHPQLPHRAL